MSAFFLKTKYQQGILISVVGIFLILSSCIPQRKLLLMQEKEVEKGERAPRYADSTEMDGTYKIQPNDYLYITIHSLEDKNTEFFNPGDDVNTGFNRTNQMLVGYYVNDSGNIHFPFLGKVQLWGQTLNEARKTMEKRVRAYVKEPVVDVKLINNTISVLGEVNKEGTYTITKAKLSVYEAITMAEGFTSFAKRNDVKVIRTTKKGTIIQTLDMSDKRLLGTELYYVYPNDLIYVEPMKAKTWGIGPTFSLYLISSLSTLVTLYLLIKSL
ncbi:MAG: polysaccharide biosynthesis/export family protein [Bacteroidales bacterium]